MARTAELEPRFFHLEKQCNETLGHIDQRMLLDLCCPRSMREQNDPWMDGIPRESLPWPSNKQHCEIDSFGRENCRAAACLSINNSFIMEGAFGDPLVAWPDFYHGVNFDPLVQLTFEEKVAFDFPRGFRWESILSKGDGDRMEWVGQSAAVGHIPVYGYRSPLVNFTESVETFDGPVLIFGWPATKNSNIYHWLQYGLSALAARWRYNIADDVPWELVVVSDPGNWLSLTEFAVSIFNFALVNYKKIVRPKDVLSTCFKDAIFAGWGDIPFSGPHDVLRWRHRLSISYPDLFPEKAERKKYVTISLRKKGWRRYIINRDELIEMVQRLVNIDNFEVRFHHDSMSFDEQLELFSNTKIFVTMWGGSLTNMIFLPPNAVLIPIYFPTFPGNQYYRMAAQANLHYLPVRLQFHDSVCWRPVEILSLMAKPFPDAAHPQPTYRERYQSRFLSKFTKGGWSHWAYNCAYSVPIEKLEVVFQQAVIIASKNIYSKDSDKNVFVVAQFGDGYESSNHICSTDAMGRRSCRSTLCLTEDSNILLPGDIDGKPVVTDGVNENEFLLPHGFDWRKVGDHQWQVGWTRTPTVLKHIFDYPEWHQKEPVLFISYPDRPMRDHFEFLQYTAGVFSARLKYNIRMGIGWHLIVVRDPHHWFQHSNWTKRMFELLTGDVLVNVVLNADPHSLCFDDVVFSGSSAIPFGGIRDVYYWRRLTEWAYPKLPLQPDKKIIFSVNDGERQFLANEPLIVEALNQRLEKFQDKFEFVDLLQVVVHDANEDKDRNFDSTIELFKSCALLITVWGSPALANMALMPPDSSIMVFDHSNAFGASELYDRYAYNNQQLFFPVRAKDEEHICPWQFDSESSPCIYNIPAETVMAVFDEAFSNSFSYLDLGFKVPMNSVKPLMVNFQRPLDEVPEGEAESSVAADKVLKWGRYGMAFSEAR
eukprot:gene1201-725_t